MADLVARDIMTADPVTVTPETSVTDAAKQMVADRIGALPVLGADGAIVGIVTESDLIMQDVRVEFPTYIHLLDGFIMYPPATQRFESELKKAVGADVADVMTSEPITVAPDATVEDVATLMVDREVSHLLVAEGGKLLGIISKSDIVRSLIAGE